MKTLAGQGDKILLITMERGYTCGLSGDTGKHAAFVGAHKEGPFCLFLKLEVRIPMVE